MDAWGREDARTQDAYMQAHAAQAHAQVHAHHLECQWMYGLTSLHTFRHMHMYICTHVYTPGAPDEAWLSRHHIVIRGKHLMLVVVFVVLHRPQHLFINMCVDVCTAMCTAMCTDMCIVALDLLVIVRQPYHTTSREECMTGTEVFKV